MAEPTDRSRRQMDREMRAMQRERERIMKDLQEMRQEMIQARAAQQTGDSETPLPPADTTNPWGSRTGSVQEISFSGSQVPSEPDIDVKQEHDSEIDKLSFAGDLSLDYQDSQGDASMEEQSVESEASLSPTFTSPKAAENTSEKVLHLPKGRDGDVEEQESQTARMLKILTDRIQVLRQDEKVIDDRKTKKERQMAEVETRLRQLKERELQLEEEQKRKEKLRLAQEEERKLILALREKEEEERRFNERLEALQLQERQALLDFKKKQQMCKTSLFIKQEEDVIPSKVKNKVLKRDTDIGNAHTSTSRDKSAEHDGLHSNRKSELDRKEAYLMQLEADLLKKEKEIRERIYLAPSVEHKTLKDIDEVKDQAEKSVDTGSAKAEVKAVSKPELTHFIKPYISQFSGVDPIPKNESSFEAWKLEIESLRRSNIFPEYLITQSIRNSLKPPARNTLLTLEPLASSDDILVKPDNVFGNVASGQSILQEFYTAVQQPEESVTMWSLRLEEILQRVAQKSVIPAEQKNEMLRERFWRSLYNTDLQNATQVHYHQTKDFEELRKKVRAEEYQRFTHKKALGEVNTLQHGKQSQVKKETQHQPLTFNTEREKREQDLLKRLENLENDMKRKGNWQNKRRRDRNSKNCYANQHGNKTQQQGQTNSNNVQQKDEQNENKSGNKQNLNL